MRAYTGTGAKNIIIRNQNALQDLKNIQNIREKAAENVKAAVAAVIDKQAGDILDSISVEELAAEKKGIRVKTLMDAGYTDMGKILKTPAGRLSQVNGISMDMAITVRDMAERMREKARQGIKIRLSADDRSESSTSLVTALYRYRCLNPLGDEAVRLLNENETEILSAITGLENTLGFFKSIFSSRAKKNAADDCYVILRDAIENGYGRKTEELTDDIRAILSCPTADAWRQFGSEPISFFSTLEQICPGVLGNDDDAYGLAKELVSEISVQDCVLTGLNCELRRYQTLGVKYILHQKRALLGDEMGLGKTIQAIAAMVAVRNQGGKYFLVICPASVMANWCREIEDKSDLNATEIHGSDKRTDLNVWLDEGGVAVTTYETASAITFSEDIDLAMIVVDEAHYIKNPEAKRTMTVRNLCKKSDRLLFMTGTALENRVDEMVNLIEVLRPDIVERLQAFRMMPMAPAFRNAVAPVYYRRKREDVLTELPDKIENLAWCRLDDEERKVYEMAVIQKKYMDARRVSWNAPDLSRSSKAERLREIVEEATTEGRKIIVFSFFLDTLSAVEKLFEGRCTYQINGSVSPETRQKIVDDFNAMPAGYILPAQIQSGGTGLNIQAASVVVICEPQLKPSIENQAIARAYRMGQTRNVLVYRLLCENTVDERILKLLADKQDIFNAFADQSDAALTDYVIDEKTFGQIMEEERLRIEKTQ